MSHINEWNMYDCLTIFLGSTISDAEVVSESKEGKQDS